MVIRTVQIKMGAEQRHFFESDVVVFRSSPYLRDDSLRRNEYLHAGKGSRHYRTFGAER